MFFPLLSSTFFFNDTATTEIYTLSLHDALPISCSRATSCDPKPRTAKPGSFASQARCTDRYLARPSDTGGDRKSTRLNSSHPSISYAVFCLKKKKKKKKQK